jgi:hypothetical protein
MMSQVGEKQGLVMAAYQRWRWGDGIGQMVSGPSLCRCAPMGQGGRLGQGGAMRGVSQRAPMVNACDSWGT